MNHYRDYPLTKAEALKFRYRKWGGNPKGDAYDPSRCAKKVHDSDYRSCLHHQCERKPGHGPDSLFCKAHAKHVALMEASDGE